MNSLSCNLV